MSEKKRSKMLTRSGKENKPSDNSPCNRCQWTEVCSKKVKYINCWRVRRWYNETMDLLRLPRHWAAMEERR